MTEENSPLGSIAAIEYLLSLDGISASETAESLRAASSGRFVSKSIFLFTLNLLGEMKYVYLFEDKVIKLKNFDRATFLLDYIKYLEKKNLLSKLIQPANLKLSSSNNQYYLFTNSISLELSSIRNFLIDSRFLIQDSSKLRLYINSEFKEAAENFIFPLIEKETAKKGLSPEALKKLLVTQEQNGYEAEQFVLEYEKKRLSNHKRVNDIQHVAAFNVSAGFDILSFSSNQSYILDREIEVKSYVGVPSFYLSRTEFERAKKNKDGYFIYLVDRERMNTKEYKPIIIETPFDSLKDFNRWYCHIENYFYSFRPKNLIEF